MHWKAYSFLGASAARQRRGRLLPGSTELIGNAEVPGASQSPSLGLPVNVQFTVNSVHLPFWATCLWPSQGHTIPGHMGSLSPWQSGHLRGTQSPAIGHLRGTQSPPGNPGHLRGTQSPAIGHLWGTQSPPIHCRIGVTQSRQPQRCSSPWMRMMPPPLRPRTGGRPTRRTRGGDSPPVESGGQSSASGSNTTWASKGLSGDGDRPRFRCGKHNARPIWVSSKTTSRLACTVQ